MNRIYTLITLAALTATLSAQPGGGQRPGGGPGGGQRPGGGHNFGLPLRGALSAGRASFGQPGLSPPIDYHPPPRQFG